MRKLLILFVFTFLFLSIGCTGQLREAALASQDIADKLNHEAIEDLYAMAVKESIALSKHQIRAAIADGTIDEMVTVKKTVNGVEKTYTMPKLEFIINNSSQTIVNAGWLKVNHAKAQHYSDLAWIYMASRENFLSVLVRDVREAYKKDQDEKTFLLENND